jgi:hypothetical protein
MAVASFPSEQGRPGHARGLAASWIWGAVLIVVHLGILWVVLINEVPASQDLDRFFEIGSSTGRPYVSFQVEHAPGTLALLRVVARAARDRRRFGVMLVSLQALADLVISVSLARTFGWPASLIYLALAVPVLALVYTRVDLLPTAAATLAVTAHHRKRPALSALALACGVGFKLWPLPLAVLFFRHQTPSSRRRFAWSFAAGLAALALAWIGVGGARGIGEVVTFRGATGWQLESVVGAALAFWQRDTLRLESGAWRLGHISPIVAPVLLASATVVALWLAWAGGGEEDRVGAAWLASATALLVCSPLLSPQYMAWLIPAAAIAWVEGDRQCAWFVGAAVILTAVFTDLYAAVVRGAYLAQALVVARNGLLVAALISSAAAIRRSAAPGRR